LTGIPGDDVPRLSQRDRQEHEEQEVQEILASYDERHRGERGDDRDPRRHPRRTHHFAKRPRGRATRTTRKMTSPTTSRYGPPKANALPASTTPKIRPPPNRPNHQPTPASTKT